MNHLEFEQLRYIMIIFDEERVHKPRKNKQIIKEEKKNKKKLSGKEKGFNYSFLSFTFFHSFLKPNFFFNFFHCVFSLSVRLPFS